MTSEFQDLRQVFATPILIYAIKDAERINARLLKEIAHRRKSEQGVVRSNWRGWHSKPDFFQRSEPAHRELDGVTVRRFPDPAAGLVASR